MNIWTIWIDNFGFDGEEGGGQQVIDTVKVHYKAEGICEPIESSKETTDVSKVVENVVDNTLNEQAVLI